MPDQKDPSREGGFIIWEKCMRAKYNQYSEHWGLGLGETWNNIFVLVSPSGGD